MGVGRFGSERDKNHNSETFTQLDIYKNFSYHPWDWKDKYLVQDLISLFTELQILDWLWTKNTLKK